MAQPARRSPRKPLPRRVIAEAANTPLGEPLPVPMAVEKDVTYLRTSIFPFCTLTCNAG